MTDSILKDIKERNDSLKAFRRNGNKDDYENFKHKRNETRCKIKDAKKFFFKNKISEVKQDSQKLWRVLNDLGCRKRAKSKGSRISLKVNDQLLTDQKEVANCFNRFFTTVADNLIKELPVQTGLYNDKLVKEYYANCGVTLGGFSFNKVNETTVYKKLTDLKCNKATGLDNIPARFIKDSANFITPVVTHILNLSIGQAKVPDELKQARVFPLFKKGSRFECNNYRPVSILSSLSKVFEKILFDQIEEYIFKCNILYELQSGFRRMHSTETTILYLTDYIKKELDKGKLSGMVLLDLQKAFDTVDHNILLLKLNAMGFDSKACKWINSYLSNRCQMVDLNGVFSDNLPISCGVPQGSVLGPLLFLMYINDLKMACSSHLLLYADDATIIVTDEKKEIIESELSREIAEVSNWFFQNKLILHLGKTEAILFGSAAKLRKCSKLEVRVGDLTITAKQEVKYLGCTLDDKLTGDSMAVQVHSKVCNRIKFLGRQAAYLDTQTLKMLAGALVQTHFDYAATFWYSGSTKRVKIKLQTAQNKLCRIILCLHPQMHLNTNHFREIGFLKVDKRVIFLKLMMVYKILQRNVPKYLCDYYVFIRDIHSFSTRSRINNIYLCRYKSLNGKNSFLYSSAVAWNELPDCLKQIQEEGLFRREVKKCLFNDV